MACVAEVVRALPEKRRIAGEGWSLRADRVELLTGDGWRALLGIRRGLTLLVTHAHQAQELNVAAWAGEPDETDGVAVIDAGGDLRLARVPLCSCGDRGCGNAGVQLDKWLPGDKLPGLVELLQQLPWTDTVPDVSNVLHGDGLTAIEDPYQDGFVTEGSYLSSPGLSEIFPLHPESRRRPSP